MYIYIYICTYICIYVCIYVYIYRYIQRFIYSDVLFNGSVDFFLRLALPRSSAKAGPRP